MNPIIRSAIIWIVIILTLLGVVQMFLGTQQQPLLQSMDYSTFINDVNANRIADVIMIDPASKGSVLQVKSKDGRLYKVISVFDQKLPERLIEKGVNFKGYSSDQEGSIFRHILEWLYILLAFLFLGYMIFRNFQGGNGKAMGFGKSRARLLNQNQKKVTFADVAGIDEAKVELEEIVEFLRDPQKFQRLGGRIPKGVLLVGPPGTGKTLLAKAISGEANVPFFSISGSDFVEMFVGVGASRVRDMFEQAKKSAPCIIFIDEIDAVGGRRGVNMGGGNDEREQTLNQLLVEMDGFEENQSIILVAATNRPDILDPALLRPGRFDRQVTVPNPDVIGREQILKVHMKKVPLSPNVDPKVIARGTPGFSGADLANLVNEAALMAARRGKLAVGKAEFDIAKDKIMMGAERRTLVMTEAEMKNTAYHEGGHAIVSFYMEDSDPIHKATIIPRGRALGMVQLLPEGDSISESRAKIIASIKVAMGGRIAEELIFGYNKVTTGASSDIKAATYYATHMITEAALGDNLGFRNYGSRDNGYGMPSKPYSEEIAFKIDTEINALLDRCYLETKQLLTEKEPELHRLAGALIERETLTGDEIRIILEGGELPPLLDVSTDDLPRTTVPSA